MSSHLPSLFPLQDERLLIAVATPREALAGLGGRLLHWRDFTVVSFTDGAPRDMEAEHAAGFFTREAFLGQLRQDLERALAVFGRDLSVLRYLGYAPGEPAGYLDDCVAELSRIVVDFRPTWIFVPAAEGLAADTDTVAWVVREAMGWLARRGEKLPRILEFSGRRGEFADNRGDVGVIGLTPGEAQAKRRAVGYVSRYTEPLVDARIFERECFREPLRPV
jgi:LmbE family N-acetylglucosaminyl deacetylase